MRTRPASIKSWELQAAKKCGFAGTDGNSFPESLLPLETIFLCDGEGTAATAAKCFADSPPRLTHRVSFLIATIAVVTVAVTGHLGGFLRVETLIVRGDGAQHILLFSRLDCLVRH